MNRSYATLVTLLAIYAAASLIHFVHNAEFVADYPNLPATWSRIDVYFAWMVLTTIGAAGWLLLSSGRKFVGLAVLAVYALLGMDSLGHYALAPMSRHTLAMNSTILFEVTAAALVLVEVTRQLVGLMRGKKERS
jgi:hypothetical protein